MTTFAISVRFSSSLARTVGQARLSLAVPAGATIADALALLQQQYPQAAAQLEAAIPVMAGQPTAPATRLGAGQELALLMPVAGG